MIFNIDDIEIFITTHNRADYLASAIKSILNQTAKVKTITVLDNESTDNTEEIVKQFESQGVKYIKTFGFLGNFNKAKEIASKKYVMLFHDDDILHPEYLELALKVLNKYDNISLITTRYTEFEGDNVPEFVDSLNENHYFFKKQKDFAAHMYFVERIAYASAIYRTIDFKNTPLEYEKYSKFNDWPFMVKISALGNSIILDDSNVYFVRRHINQDTWTSTNTPSIQQIINWDKCFYEAMNLKFGFFPKLKLCFKVKCKDFMEGKYNSFLSDENKKEFPLEFLWQKAREEKLSPFFKKNVFLHKLMYTCLKDINKKYKLNNIQKQEINYHKMIEEKKLTEPINVTKPFLPPVKEYQYYIEKIFDKCWLTNQGPLLSELEDKLSEYLDVDNFHFVANGTIALQLAIKALGIEQGEIITTPFSYVATSSSILWEKCKPVFVDVEPNNFTIDAGKIEQAITPETKAIMAVHVFGFACDVEKIDKIAQKYNLKVIYDAAHAFGAKYNDKSLLSYGDISTCSFHSTKLFHTIEGGACIAKDKEINEILELSKRFGHNGDNHLQLGINAKNSEMHAAMGLANLPYIEKIIQERKHLSDLYDDLLQFLQKPSKQEFLEYNYAYYPVIFESEKQLIRVFEALNKENIFPRRYFYPSLNKINYIQGENCPISENISPRIACLPLYCGLEKEQVEKISNIIKRNL